MNDEEFENDIHKSIDLMLGILVIPLVFCGVVGYVIYKLIGAIL